MVEKATSPGQGSGMTDAPRIFSDDYYERMRRLEAASWWNAGMRDIAASLIARARLKEHGNLLDVGCGSGQTMSWFMDGHRGWTAAGIDIAQDGVSAARSTGLAVVTGNALELPFAPESSDLVVTLDVLQHLPLAGGDLTCLREIWRVLRPGGSLFVRTNCQSIPRTEDDPENDFRKYEPGDLRVKLHSAGFQVVSLSRANAVLGFAEVAREIRATKRAGSGYHGLLAVPVSPGGLAYAAKRAMLRLEARLIAAGVELPFGRSIVALCRKPAKRSTAAFSTEVSDAGV